MLYMYPKVKEKGRCRQNCSIESFLNVCAEDNYLPAKQQPKSLYVSHALSHFYETDFEIFGLVLGGFAILKISAIKLKYTTFEGSLFYVFIDKMNRN